MDIATIIKNESTNHGPNADLYYNSKVDMWTAFGNSAYAIRLYVKNCGYDNLRGYSTECNLPCTVICNRTLKHLRHELKILQEEENCHIRFQTPIPFEYTSYLKWCDALHEDYVKKEDFNIQTHVSEFVPKGEFIPDSMSSFSRNSKRILDCFAALCAMILFSPLFLFCYIMVKREDGGHAIFKQERIGRFGRPFYIYKFRSMNLRAEENGPQLSHSGGDNDPRLTKIGKFLRAHHLDELPQLWNVFCGDMAFIGPRPERKFYIDQILEYDKRYVYLYQIRPGVTSYATLYNGYTDTMEKMLRRLEYDLYYLQHRSLWFDVKILTMTFLHIAFGKKI